MVVYKNKSYVTNSKYPDSDFMGNADFVIPDGSELAEKIIRAYPYFELVFDGENLVDIEKTERPPAPPEPPTNAELAAAIAELAEVICGG